jgi:hypothetical protein
MAKTPWIWEQAQQAAFDAVKRILSTAPVLAYPDFTLMINFIVTTDASQVGIGAVLSQTGADGVERPIFIASCVTTSGESRYAPTALEALAVVHYMELFKPYVGGCSFKVVTDHRTLVWHFSSPRSSMYLRWILRLQQYDFTVEYRPGKYNLVADAVSRGPVPGGSDDLDEPVEPLFLAIALPHRHLLTRTSGLTSCQACLTVPLAPPVFVNTWKDAAILEEPPLRPTVSNRTKSHRISRLTYYILTWLLSSLCSVDSHLKGQYLCLCRIRILQHLQQKCVSFVPTISRVLHVPSLSTRLTMRHSFLKWFSLVPDLCGLILQRKRSQFLEQQRNPELTPVYVDRGNDFPWKMPTTPCLALSSAIPQNRTTASTFLEEVG